MNYKILPYSKYKKKSLKDLFAVPSAEDITKISKLLDRVVESTKDTEDYNNSHVSKYYDLPSLLMQKAGMAGIKSGDTLKIREELRAILHDRENLDFFYNFDSYTSSYEVFPFSWQIQQDLRAHFILKTSKKDTLSNLIDEIEGDITQYCSIEDWAIVNKAIESSRKRLKKSKYKLLAPEVSVGHLVKVSNLDIKTFELDEEDAELFYENRSDELDLIALKELSNMTKGEKVHPLTIGPSFFAKIMPELKELGVKGVVLEVYQNRLNKIILNKDSDLEDYSPIDASIVLSEAFFKEEGTYTLNHTRFKDTRFYVVVDGCVAAPENKTPLEYSSLSVNTLKVRSGEVFLFELSKEHNVILNTRICFVPYNYSNLHLIHQHGSAVYGNNDQSFHSIMNAEENTFDDFSIEEFKEKVKKDKGLLYEPNILGALTYLDDGEDEGALGKSEILFKESNKDVLIKALEGLFEESSFTIMHYLKDFSKIKKENFRAILELLEYHCSLNKRFLLMKYLKEDDGIVSYKIPTTYRTMSEFLKEDSQVTDYMAKLKEKYGKKE